MDNWKSLYIYFISGTGNARVSSEWIARKLKKKDLKHLCSRLTGWRILFCPGQTKKPLIGFAFPPTV